MWTVVFIERYRFVLILTCWYGTSSLKNIQVRIIFQVHVAITPETIITTTTLDVLVITGSCMYRLFKRVIFQDSHLLQEIHELNDSFLISV